MLSYDPDFDKEGYVKFSTCGLVAAMLVAGALRAGAQTPTIQSDLLKDWTNMKETMTKIADAMPEDKYGFKPTPAQRSFGEQMLHVAGANVGIMKVLGAKATAPTIDQKATKKADIMKALAESFDYGIAAIKEQNEQTIAEVVQGPRFMGPSTRARVVWFLLGHAWDEYGVVTTYLRLNNIVPPASRNSM